MTALTQFAELTKLANDLPIEAQVLGIIAAIVGIARMCVEMYVALVKLHRRGSCESGKDATDDT